MGSPPAAPDPRDHPRACGEKLTRLLKAKIVWGSPPRMRGKVACPAFTAGAVGITPAHAGKRTAAQQYGYLPKDHPRACGEKVLKPVVLHATLGSPPRMRGKVLRLLIRVRQPRITPAHAGKSCSCYDGGRRYRDHPRACGEKTKKIPYHRLFPLRSAPFSFSFA